jgi:hypothetical protein
MFTPFPEFGRAAMADYERDANRRRLEKAALEAASIDGDGRRVRFPVAEWLKRAPFVLRTAR